MKPLKFNWGDYQMPSFVSVKTYCLSLRRYCSEESSIKFKRLQGDCCPRIKCTRLVQRYLKSLLNVRATNDIQSLRFHEILSTAEFNITKYTCSHWNVNIQYVKFNVFQNPSNSVDFRRNIVLGDKYSALEVLVTDWLILINNL